MAKQARRIWPAGFCPLQHKKRHQAVNANPPFGCE
ncbi:hypothetical protein F441_06071 [Phytophthora nicotianae CJ01A1]|uniref:Uncharacterized protein n=6 Tax=Phytophthora nicotianae TaxID=4792 RepID=W2RCC0_PHYN3|nr:hypothetical protein PPTG_20896 [Phytophthora nicotianae INRA-310]ETI50375.1 hypothetical protein F443_06058 [Phytophthora nicotianae P1569]ETK90248.1 hypothetical protein L915_05938 [Phytophthora nicotianae]ETO79135.1 hypothetical protein F444_06116 [Phytophthora nicotianae P1976]ETP20139.1 hypothetical protein F441_06071 [Phytophthora nicotianae CJ01A1]ETP48078.1 hypothetical protein F442_06096 [Phytophthora nicotianae P10297]